MFKALVIIIVAQVCIKKTETYPIPSAPTGGILTTALDPASFIRKAIFGIAGKLHSKD